MHLKKEKKNLKTIEATKQKKKIGFSERTSVIIPRGKDWELGLVF